ncbi:PRD domain-containing protein [Escherichia coli]|nr:PRD domain-containing protein [Escherichia coli]
METRLNLLCDAGVIDKDICKGMMQVVNVLETECHLPVRSEQGTMAMTHMASALMRSRRGEEIEPLDDELLAELAQSSHWQAVVQLHQVLLKEFALEVNPCEEGYLLANLYGLPRFYVSTSKSIIKALINMHSFEIQLSPIG